MDNCIFCKIAKGEIPATKVYEDKDMVAFKDLEPQAPVHILIIPKVHVSSLDDVTEEHQQLLGKMAVKIKEIAKEAQLENGYRIVCNTGEDGGQTVSHLHFHLLGKRKLTWPPG